MLTLFLIVETIHNKKVLSQRLVPVGNDVMIACAHCIVKNLEHNIGMCIK